MSRNYLIVLAGFVVIIIVAFVIFACLPGFPRPTSTSVPVFTPAPPLQEKALPFEDRLNSTTHLLREPVGGFQGPLVWVSNPETVSWDYIFYPRGYGPAKVTLTVYEVSSPLNTTTITPSTGISARMVPDRFTAIPGKEGTSQLVVNITPAGFSHDPVTRTIYVHADVEGAPDAVADDWIRVRMGDRPTIYLSYQTTGDISGRDITIRREDRGKANLTIRLGERGTGPVRVWFKELDCKTMFMSSEDIPQPPSPDWPVINIDPDQFIGRSFGFYELPVTISANAPGVQPGTYCYGINIDTSDDKTSFSWNVNVIP